MLSRIEDLEEVQITIVVNLHHHHQLLSSKARVGRTAFAQVGSKVVIPQRFSFVSRCVSPMSIYLIAFQYVPLVNKKREKDKQHGFILQMDLCLRFDYTLCMETHQCALFGLHHRLHKE